VIGLSTLSRPNRPNRRSWALIYRSMEMAASLPDPMASASEPESWTRTLKVVLFAGPEGGEGELAHQLYILTDIVKTRLRRLNLPRKMSQACHRDAFEILPRSAQRRRPRSRMPSIGARTRASASYALHTGPPSHPRVGDRRQASLGRCRPGASVDPGQLPVCCRTGQQGKQRARVLILLASHFPIVHRICDSIPGLAGLVKFALVSTVRPGAAPPSAASTPRPLRRR
jgi:hypothetical protein